MTSLEFVMTSNEDILKNYEELSKNHRFNFFIEKICFKHSKLAVQKFIMSDVFDCQCQYSGQNILHSLVESLAVELEKKDSKFDFYYRAIKDILKVPKSQKLLLMTEKRNLLPIQCMADFTPMKVIGSPVCDLKNVDEIKKEKYLECAKLCNIGTEKSIHALETTENKLNGKYAKSLIPVSENYVYFPWTEKDEKKLKEGLGALKNHSLAARTAS